MESLAAPPAAESYDGADAATAVVIVLGVVALIVACCIPIIAYLWWKKRGQPKNQEKQQQEKQQEQPNYIKEQPNFIEAQRNEEIQSNRSPQEEIIDVAITPRSEAAAVEPEMEPAEPVTVAYIPPSSWYNIPAPTDDGAVADVAPSRWCCDIGDAGNVTPLAVPLHRLQIRL